MLENRLRGQRPRFNELVQSLKNLDNHIEMITKSEHRKSLPDYPISIVCESQDENQMYADSFALMAKAFEEYDKYAKDQLESDDDEYSEILFYVGKLADDFDMMIRQSTVTEFDLLARFWLMDGWIKESEAVIYEDEDSEYCDCYNLGDFECLHKATTNTIQLLKDVFGFLAE